MTVSDNSYFESLLFCDGITVFDGCVWAICVDKNLLLGINLCTGEYTKCLWIPTKRNTGIPFRYMSVFKERLCLIPYDETYLCFYDPCKDVFECVDVPQEFFMPNVCCRLVGVIVDNNRMIFYGSYSRVLIYTITDTGNDFRWIDLEKNKPTEIKNKNWFWTNGYHGGERIRLVMQEAPYVVTIDCDNGEVLFDRIPGEDKAIDNVNISGEVIVYSPRGKLGTIKRYNIKTKELKIIYKAEAYNDTMRCFGYVFGDENVVVLLPGQNNQMAIVNKSDENILQNYDKNTYTKLGTIFPYELIYRNAYVTDYRHIITINPWEGQIVDIDIDAGSVCTKKVCVSDQLDKNQMFSSIVRGNNGRIIYEKASGMLETFLDVVCDSR